MCGNDTVLTGGDEELRRGEDGRRELALMKVFKEAGGFLIVEEEAHAAVSEAPFHVFVKVRWEVETECCSRQKPVAGVDERGDTFVTFN